MFLGFFWDLCFGYFSKSNYYVQFISPISCLVFEVLIRDKRFSDRGVYMG